MVTKELVAASSRPIVLSILAKGDSYGYEIIKKVATLSNQRLQWTDGMLYPVLHRLEKEGLIKGYWHKAESGRRRKYYRITVEGKRSLTVEMEQWGAVNSTLTGLQEGMLCFCC